MEKNSTEVEFFPISCKKINFPLAYFKNHFLDIVKTQNPNWWFFMKHQTPYYSNSLSAMNTLSNVNFFLPLKIIPS